MLASCSQKIEKLILRHATSSSIISLSYISLSLTKASGMGNFEQVHMRERERGLLARENVGNRDAESKEQCSSKECYRGRMDKWTVLERRV
jgi:hypothetical protein